MNATATITMQEKSKLLIMVHPSLNQFITSYPFNNSTESQFRLQTLESLKNRFENCRAALGTAGMSSSFDLIIFDVTRNRVVEPGIGKFHQFSSAEQETFKVGRATSAIPTTRLRKSSDLFLTPRKSGEPQPET
jgi:hypothetical protein